MTLTLSRSPSIAGSERPVMVGKRKFTFPSGLRFAHSTHSGSRVLWVMDPADGNRVYCFTEGGEVTGIPGALLGLVRSKIFGVS